jgi:phosphopantothenoylcysteine decarboxylase/phosphopantothenate--cysteine ligase
MLKNKTVILGVTGSIAAYKIANLSSMLVKLNCDVHVIMTKNALNFINPITFETITKNKCLVDTFDRDFEFDVKHISLAKKADLILVAPASANIIGKVSNGIADDMLSTTIMASKATTIFSPAMNTNMYENKIVQDNIKKLMDYGYKFIEPASGFLACGDKGKGKLPSEELLVSYIIKEIALEKDLVGKKVLITAGATRESLDPVRFITNHSSGKMGFSLAKMAKLRGAEVLLIKANTTAKIPDFLDIINVENAEDMYNAVLENYKEYDIIIKAAAVSDYTPVYQNENKIKKSEENFILELKKTKDILAFLGENKKNNQFICGFSMETENLIENSRKKLINKNVNMIVANNLNIEGAGFSVDTNLVTIITEKTETTLPLMDKDEVANTILSFIISFNEQ